MEDNSTPIADAAVYGRVAGKIAIVTGAGAGIGQASAITLAREGAILMLADTNEDGLRVTKGRIEALGGRAVYATADVAEDEDAVNAMVARTAETFGGVDILVNNVGGSRRSGRIWEMSTADWDHVTRLNLRPAFLCTRAVVPHMIKRSSGRIICISSGAYKGSPWKAYFTGGSDYATGKAGVVGFTRHVALELAEFNITVNAIAPGPIVTERFRESFRRMEEERGHHSPLRVIPLRRLGEPREIADTVLFLASQDASYITGETIHVTGGR